MSSQSAYGCQDYRTEMILIGLQARLNKEDLTEEERQAIKEEIRRIEADYYG